MINIKNLSLKKKRTILSVLNFAKQNRYNVYELKRFFQKNKWKAKSGSFKLCYIKNGIVVKFSSLDFGKTECTREYEQWLAVPKPMRKHFAKVYAFKGNILIQEVVPECPNPYKCYRIQRLKKKYWPKLEDTDHNHGHKDGVVKFFDWVYYRKPIYINTKRRLPGSKRRIL